MKLAGLAFEAHRNAQRLERAFAQVAVGAISGAVGTYSATSPEFEARVLQRLDLEREDVSTQVVARDRHAELLSAIALAGAGLERFATEIRHLQRTEVREVEEPFRAGQKGSSAMPHKRNPIKSEQISASRACCAATPRRRWRTSRCGTSATSPTPRVERVILPDSTILLDYMQHLAIALVEGMKVNARADAREPRADPRRAVLPARAAGARRGPAPSRDDAYRIVQELAQRAWDERHAAARAARGRRPRGRPGPRRDLRPTTTTRATPSEIVARLDAIA